MAVIYDERSDRFLGTATVFIARDGRVSGYWDALPEATPAALELPPPHR